MISRCMDMESTELLTGAIDCTLVPWLCTGRPFVFASVLLSCRRVVLGSGIIDRLEYNIISWCHPCTVCGKSRAIFWLQARASGIRPKIEPESKRSEFRDQGSHPEEYLRGRNGKIQPGEWLLRLKGRSPE